MFILMEKLPGRDLTTFDTFPPDKRYEVRIAFGRAIRYVVSPRFSFFLSFFSMMGGCTFRNLGTRYLT